MKKEVIKTIFGKYNVGISIIFLAIFALQTEDLYSQSMEIPAFIMNIESPMSTQEVEFTYNSAFLPQSTAATWNWNFGDGSSSTDENPTHTFSLPGTYEVQIQITDGDGTNHNYSRMIKVWGEKWSYNIGFQIKIQIPTIADDGTIYIGSEDNTNFHAINSDGSLKWTYAGLGDNVYSSASIGSDGTIYVGAKDSKLHAINPDGTSKWKFTMSGDPIGVSPAIASDGTIYIGTDGDNMYAINPDGTEKWVFSTSMFNVRSTPAIATDGTVYIASDDNNLYALNPATGTMNWSFDIGGDVDGGVAIDGNGTIIVSVDQGGSTGAVYAVNPDGTEKWSTTTSGRIISSPAIANGSVYVGTKDSNKLYAFSSSNGTELWSFTAGDIILSSPSVDRNGTIYFGSFDDHVYAINSDGTEKYKFDTDQNVWSSVVIGSDGTAYIGGYDKKLHAFEFFAEGLATDAWPMFAKNVKHTGRAIAPTVSTEPESNLTSNSATLNGDITSDGGNDITERGFVYSSSSSEDLVITNTAVMKEEVSGTETGVFSADITGLTAGITYYYKAYATNNSARTSYGAVMNFTIEESALNNKDFESTYFSISPNPTGGVLYISVAEKTDYKLLNTRGQILKKGVLTWGASKINLTSLPKGIYLLNIKTSKGSFAKKVVRK